MSYLKSNLFMFFTTALLVSGISLYASDDKKTVRAAIDFGSGAIKIQTAVINTKDNTIVGNAIHSEYVSLNLTENVAANNGIIGADMELRAIEVLQGFKARAIEAAAKEGYKTVEFSGVATAVFRKAKNGAEFLDKIEKELDIKLVILSQDEEGQLGFMTAKALYPQVAEENLLVWDSGNGSFQLTAKVKDDLYVFQGPLGHGVVRLLLTQDVRGTKALAGNESGCPISPDEGAFLGQQLSALFPETPEWLQKKLNDSKTVVVTFGEKENVFALSAQASAFLQGLNRPVSAMSLTLSNIQKAAEVFYNKTDDVFAVAGLHFKTLTGVSLVKTVMEHFGIQQIEYVKTSGNTSGMLISPQFWE